MAYLKADGFDDAILGIDCNQERIIYDISVMIEILVKDGMTQEDALEYLNYNVLSAYVGDNTPIYIYTMGINEINDL
jgi:hypothetical protein